MNDAVITLNGLEKRFPGMDKPAVAPLDCTIHAGYVICAASPARHGSKLLLACWSLRLLARLPDAWRASSPVG